MCHKMQAHRAGHREEWRKLERGGWGKRLGGWRDGTGKEMESSFDRELQQRQPILIWVGSREEEMKHSIKFLIQL